MSTYLQRVIYLSQADYDTIASGTPVTHGTITISSIDPNTIYFTDGKIAGSDFPPQVANTIFAAPNGSNGTPTFRALTANDIPVLDDYVKVTGDTMTGVLQFENSSGTWPTDYPFLKAIGANNKEFHFSFSDNGNNMDIGYHWGNGDGAGLGLRSSTYSTAAQQGNFYLYARKGSTYAALHGSPAGVLTWNGRRVVTATDATAIGSTNTPVYVDNNGQVVSTGKSFANYLLLSGENNMTGDLNLIMGDSDRAINFWYDTNKKAGASWRIAGLGSGSSDTNYFVIQSGTSTTSATTWNNTVRIGQNTYDIAIAGNLYPLVTNTKTLGTADLNWSNMYSTAYRIANKVELQYNTTTDSLDFVFI